MEVVYTPGNGGVLQWSASDPGGEWFTAELSPEPTITVISATDQAIAGRLVHVLNAARSLNPEFLMAPGTYQVNNQLAFNRLWGWGSSSTLIANLAGWANVDPFILNRLVSGGSGYDIACARSDSPLLYRLVDNLPVIRQIAFNPEFRDHITFVFLGKKQDTAAEIQQFNPDPVLTRQAAGEISAITEEMLAATGLIRFNSLIDKHEAITGDLLGRRPVRESIFPGFNGSVKSLGAWGGDFIMACSPDNFQITSNYFQERGYPATFSWNEIIL
jgi:hypothetical protein